MSIIYLTQFLDHYYIYNPIIIQFGYEINFKYNIE